MLFSGSRSYWGKSLLCVRKLRSHVDYIIDYYFTSIFEADKKIRVHIKQESKQGVGHTSSGQ